MTEIRRPLNWYGSKERLCSVIHALIPEGPNTWVDLFCGSAVVTLKKPRHRREVVNDLNGDVVNLFEVLRGPSAADLYRRVELTPYAEALLHQVYGLPPTDAPVDRAWRFLVESWFGRGGDAHRTGFRWSKSQNTSPELTWAAMPARLQAVAERLRGVCIRSDEALSLIDDYDTSDCILFVDPPYPGPVGRRYAIRMSVEQHRALAVRLARCRASVILTMNPDTLYADVLVGWTEHRVSVLGGGGARKTEHILINFEPLARRSQGCLFESASAP